MPVQKQVLLLFPLILLFFCFPVVSLASTTTSQAGIVFTESDESAKKKELDEKKIPSTGSEEVKKEGVRKLKKIDICLKLVKSIKQVYL